MNDHPSPEQNAGFFSALGVIVAFAFGLDEITRALGVQTQEMHESLYQMAMLATLVVGALVLLDMRE